MKSRSLPRESVLRTLCVTVLLTIPLGLLVGYGLARALLALAPVTLSEVP